MMSNEITCDLFGYQRDELIGMKVQNLFTEPYRAKQHALVERNIDSSGKEVLVSGKVVGTVIPQDLIHVCAYIILQYEQNNIQSCIIICVCIYMYMYFCMCMYIHVHCEIYDCTSMF